MCVQIEDLNVLITERWAGGSNDLLASLPKFHEIGMTRRAVPDLLNCLVEFIYQGFRDSLRNNHEACINPGIEQDGLVLRYPSQRPLSIHQGVGMSQIGPKAAEPTPIPHTAADPIAL